MKKQAILSPKLSKPVGVFSHAVKAQGEQFLFISGLTARDINGNPVGKGDMRAQTKQILKNMKIILDEAGATLRLSTIKQGTEPGSGERLSPGPLM